MEFRIYRLGAAMSVVIAAGLVAACGAPTVASMNCDRIAEEAKQISQGQSLKITNLTNLREISRTETEARCQGSAAMSNNATTDMYLRAYRANDGGTIVEYNTEPFAALGGQAAPTQPAQAPAPSAPPSQEQPSEENQQ